MAQHLSPGDASEQGRTSELKGKGEGRKAKVKTEHVRTFAFRPSSFLLSSVLTLLCVVGVFDFLFVYLFRLAFRAHVWEENHVAYGAFSR